MMTWIDRIRQFEFCKNWKQRDCLPGIQSTASGLNMFLNNRDHRKITVVDGKVRWPQAVITWQMSILTIHIHTENGRIRESV